MRTIIDSSRLGRIELVPILVNAALIFLSLRGREERVDGIRGPVKSLDENQLEILLRTPKTEIPTAPSNYGLDIWFDHRKVFSVCWNSNQLRDYEVVSFKRGPWIPVLLSLSEASLP
jgi:hypothetical protein